MRSKLLLLALLSAAWTVVPLASAFAQQGGGDDQGDSGESKKKKKDEWELRQAPLPSTHAAGACPYVKVLYDAARFEEFKNDEEASSAVAYTGEIQGVTSDCTYKGDEPIVVKVAVQFMLGRGPQATDSHKSYGYWVAVTHRNRSVLAKQEFSLPVAFPNGQDRVGRSEQLGDIVIPRKDSSVAGDNFEILIGFDVSPTMAEFNEDGKRFHVDAGAPTTVAEAKSGGK